jgi:hypothetical protein
MQLARRRPSGLSMPASRSLFEIHDSHKTVGYTQLIGFSAEY